MENVDITGAWEVKIAATGDINVSSGSKWTAFITADQSGSSVSGTFLTVHGLSGKLTGSVSGNEVSMTIAQGPIRPGTFHGVAKVDANNKRMSGTYGGSDSAGTLQASFVAFKKKSYVVALKRWWWRNLFPVITRLVVLVLAIMSLLAIPLSAGAAIMFYKQGSLILCGISVASILGSFISVCMWFSWTWGVGSLEILYEDLHSHDLPLWGMILTWDVFVFTTINLIALYLFIHALPMQFSWW